jgi:RsiW-degrading membrane proteinase PrsW (M82 family)
MSGLWVLLILILISSIPVIAVYIWFRVAKYQFSLVQFLFTLLAGAAAFFPALILQEHLTFSSAVGTRGAPFLREFVRIAFTEEISRLLMLFIFFWISSRIKPASSAETDNIKRSDENPNPAITYNKVKEGTAIGLVAGLGFALLESAVYAASDSGVLFLRIFTAALHGACGSRVGAAAVMFRSNPIQAVFRILTAVAIHGVYNFMVGIPGIPSIAAVFVALSAFATAILTIRGGWISGKIKTSSH